MKKIKLRAITVSLLGIAYFGAHTVSAEVVSKEKMYTNVTVTRDIFYRSAINYQGTTDSLKLDLYAPEGAPDTLRPCVLLLHGGSFITGTKTDTLMTTFSSELALRGYIAVSIDYRLGVNILDIAGLENDFNRALYRATQDSKAALRFLRANASQYRIDTANIFCGGYSAGAITSAHHAYMNQAEAATKIDTAGLGLLESGEDLDNPSSFKAVVNYCGAIGDTNWLDSKDIPIISFHGTADTIVPYTEGNAFKLPVFPYLFGSGTINRIHLQLGIEDSLYTAPGEQHALSLATIAMSILKVSEFLYNHVNPSNTSIRNREPIVFNKRSLMIPSKASLFSLNGRQLSSGTTRILPGIYIKDDVKNSVSNKKLIVKVK
ncbi:MAG: alpha/beta hydrolase [Chitinispirillaceae bacterium]|nr:alpha/beta hydrolase [Chitinispirillaceae bacterium]